jgi:cyclohexanone monooxygenase
MDEIARFTSSPSTLLAERRRIESRMNSGFSKFIHGSDAQHRAQRHVRAEMERRLAGSEELQDALIPDFPFGCRRPTPGVGYLEALTDPKVQIVRGAEIAQVTPEQVVLDDGRSYTVDVIVCATGFDASYRPRFPVVGHAGEPLWQDDVSAYLGLAVPGFPNYFRILGPNCPVGNGPVLIVIEQQVAYIVHMLAKLQKENLRACEVSAEATQTFNAWKDAFMQHTVWTSGCRSWYHGGDRKSRVIALWPGSTLHYLEAIHQPRYEDWTWTRDAEINPWAFLGNGMSSAEARPGGNLTWYLRTEDDEAVDPCLVSSHLAA